MIFGFATLYPVFLFNGALSSGYLRLSMISCDMGKFDDASLWLSRSLLANEDEPDTTLCLGDLYSRSGNVDDAKRCYDKVCSAVSHLLLTAISFCLRSLICNIRMRHCLCQ